MKILAIIGARNEIVYLREVIPYLKDQAIDVVLIDNDSTDGTLEELSGPKYSNLIHVERLPFDGTLDMTRQMEIKQRLAATAGTDWVIHHDADEIMQSGTEWGGLRRNMELAESQGYNTLNFNELVMLPADPEVDDFIHNNSNYYFFDPRPLRLMRAWKMASGLTNIRTGGHILDGDVIVSPTRMLLKHFIVRSQKHAIDKYVGRRFSEREVRKGWHRERMGLTPENLRIPTVAPWLHKLNDPKDTPEKLPRSARVHYWQWSAEDKARAE